MEYVTVKPLSILSKKQLAGEINYIKVWQRRINTTTGTKAGGLKAAKKNLERDPDFYRKIGKKGGKNGHTGGFAANPELAKLAGAKGGRISRRGPSKKKIAKKIEVKIEPWPEEQEEQEPNKKLFLNIFRRNKR